MEGFKWKIIISAQIYLNSFVSILPFDKPKFKLILRWFICELITY